MSSNKLILIALILHLFAPIRIQESEAMPRGHHDYNVGYGVVQPIKNYLPDLNTVLGGVVSFDDIGRPIYATDFRNGVGDWYTVGSGTGVAPYVATGYLYSFRAPAGLRMSVSANNDLSRMFKYFGKISNTKTGVELMINPTVSMGEISIQVTHNDSDNNSFGFQVYYDPAGQEWEIQTDEGRVAVLDYSSLVEQVTNWTPLKLVWDVELNRYERLLFGTQVVNLTDYVLTTEDQANAGQLTVAIIYKGLTGYLDDLGLGQIVVTIDEP